MTLTGAFLSKHEMANKRLYATCFMMGSRSIAISLFRESPPNLEAVRDSAIIKAQTQHSLKSEKDYHKRMASLQKTLIRPISSNVIDDIGADKSHWAMSNDSVLWRERTILLLLWILCAAALLIQS